MPAVFFFYLHSERTGTQFLLFSGHFVSFANFLFCNHKVHLPSLTAFSNWPTSSTPLGHVTAIDFAARSEYVAIGNTRGRVLLYHLKDYGASSIAGY
jgi:hypothetical protein